MYYSNETDPSMNINTTYSHTITCGQWVAPEVVLLTNEWFFMAQSVSRVTLEGHGGANRQVVV